MEHKWCDPARHGSSGRAAITHGASCAYEQQAPLLLLLLHIRMLFHLHLRMLDLDLLEAGAALLASFGLIVVEKFQLWHDAERSRGSDVVCGAVVCSGN